MQKLLSQQKLFRTLFEVMPTGVILVDKQERIVAINSAAQAFFQVSDSEAFQRPGGEALHCGHVVNPGDCGNTSFCKDCILRKSVELAFNGEETSRSKGSFHQWQNGQPVRRDILVTATQMHFDGHVLAIVIIEEISNITRIQGLLPICCSCYRVRDEEGEWTRIDQFLEKHSEADFSHDVCPVCVEQMKRRA